MARGPRRMCVSDHVGSAAHVRKRPKQSPRPMHALEISLAKVLVAFVLRAFRHEQSASQCFGPFASNLQASA